MECRPWRVARVTDIPSSGDCSQTVCVIVGTRPGIIKQSPLIRALERRGEPYMVVHSGQHYSPDMDAQFFDDLELPVPAYRVENPGHALQGAQTAQMLAGIEAILVRERPRIVLVGGDANTNLAAALAARKLHIPVGHVEAGLRSFDWRMPEEHNRVIIDHISELLFAPTDTATRNLKSERVRGAIHRVGNTIVDAVFQHAALAARRSNILERLGMTPDSYAVLTAHREENVDNPGVLASILTGVDAFSRRTEVPVIFPMHPRTKKRIIEFGLSEFLRSTAIQVTEPAGYLDFLRLLSASKLLLTDSGGAQQEACIVDVPCVTLRENTEWVETVEIGANIVAGTDAGGILDACKRALGTRTAWKNPFGNGRAGEEVIEIALRPIPVPE